MRLFCLWVMMVSVNALADDGSLSLEDEEVYIIPASNVKEFLQKASRETFLKASWIGNPNTRYCTIGTMLSGQKKRLHTLTSFTGSSDNLEQVTCYRCGLGQSFGKINERWCTERDFLWDQERSIIKGRCK